MCSGDKRQSGPEAMAQAEERRLEIENRIRNLFWTVSGDYTLEIKPDVETFVRAKSLALYDAIRQGAFVRHFDVQKLALYILQKQAKGANPTLLLELTRLCVDEAAYSQARRERGGVEEIRRQAFRELLELGDFSAPLGQIRGSLLRRFLREPDDTPAELLPAVEAIEALASAGDTDAIVQAIDRLYNTFLDTGFEAAHGDLNAVLRVTRQELLDYPRTQEMADSQMRSVLEAYLSAAKDALLRPTAPGTHRRLTPQQAPEPEDLPEPSEAEAEKVYRYMERQFGKSFLTRQEQQRLNRQFCTGIHKRCTLYVTQGVLSNPAVKNTQFLRTQMQSMKNEMYFTMKQQVIRRAVKVLAAMLKQVQIQRLDEDAVRADSGLLVPARLWKVGRTGDNKLFDRKKKRENAGFVVDILIDGSGSQTLRQPQIAAQGYLVSQALSEAGIPHRVSSFCSYWDYTMLHRFRDYDEAPACDKAILQFRAFGENRDGLAIRAVCDGLRQRREETKILIFLSDGRPNHLGTARPGCRKPAPYVGEEAVRDTAFEVRKVRGQGISVLGIFVGSEEELPAEKKIFGKEFVYTRNISSFAHIVGAYLRRLMEQD